MRVATSVQPPNLSHRRYSTDCFIWERLDETPGDTWVILVAACDDDMEMAPNDIEVMLRLFHKVEAIPPQITASLLSYLKRAERLAIASNHLTGVLTSIFTSKGAYAEEMMAFQNETVLCRAFDSFEGYLINLLVEIFTTRPDALKSNEKVSVDEILRQNNMPQLLFYLAERKGDLLAAKGMAHLLSYLDERLGLHVSSEEAETVILAAELRNLITHNDAVVDERFAEKAPGGPYEIGKKLESRGRWVPLGLSLACLAISIDNQAIKMHTLSTVSAPPEWLRFQAGQ